MDKNPVMIACLQRQTAHPVQVLGRQIARIAHPVAIKGLFAAVAPPSYEIAIGAIFVGRSDQKFFVVAAKANEMVTRIGLPLH
jgi:hypothetical protein